MRAAIIIFALLCGCASPGPVVEVTKPVVIDRVQYVALPQGILSPCPGQPSQLQDGISNGELRRVALDWQNVYGACLLQKLESVRRLQPE